MELQPAGIQTSKPSESVPPPADFAVQKPSVLETRERVSIVNALMAEDRTEIREIKQMVFTLTYYVVPGSIGIASFAVNEPKLKWVLLLGLGLVITIYVIAHLILRKWLTDARNCLAIRELFYKQQNLLFAHPFDPLRHVTSEDITSHHIKDTHLWIPFAFTVVAGVLLMCYIGWGI